MGGPAPARDGHGSLAAHRTARPGWLRLSPEWPPLLGDTVQNSAGCSANLASPPAPRPLQGAQPLIRTCRLGPRPPRPELTSVAVKLANSFLCALSGYGLQELWRPVSSPGPGRGRCSCGLWLPGLWRLWLPGVGLAHWPMPRRVWHLVGPGKGPLDK